jgi:hypothetical protein
MIPTALPLADTTLQLEIGIPLLVFIGILNLVIVRNRRNRP